MKILLVRHYRPDALRSMMEFGSAVANYLETHQYDVRSIEPRAILGKGKNTMAGKAKLLGYADKFILFPRELRRAAKEADVVHLCGPIHALYMSHLQAKPCLVTCHDLLAGKARLGEAGDHKVEGSGKKLQDMIWANLPKADHIACVSSATLRDLQQYMKLKPGQGSVIWNGVYEPITRMPHEKSARELKVLGVEEPYLFHLGGNQFYKNRRGVVRIFAELKKLPGTERLKLVMAGKPLPSDVRQAIDESGVSKDITVHVDVSFDAKVALYSRAHALLFPSTAEGFGLPLVESQMCGTPVITSDISPMNEIVADSGVLIDPHDEAGAAAKIHARLWSLSDLVPAGYENAKRFQIDRMGEDYVAAYRRILR